MNAPRRRRKEEADEMNEAPGSECWQANILHSTSAALSEGVACQQAAAV